MGFLGLVNICSNDICLIYRGGHQKKTSYEHVSKRNLNMSILYVLHVSTRFLYVSNLHVYFSYVLHVSTRFFVCPTCIYENFVWSNLHVHFRMSNIYLQNFCVCLIFMCIFVCPTCIYVSILRVFVLYVILVSKRILYVFEYVYCLFHISYMYLCICLFRMCLFHMS